MTDDEVDSEDSHLIRKDKYFTCIDERILSAATDD
jgi:hypothetical protein